ncbi:MAG: hypothetical protein JWR54_4039 [Mucilaginibacter sp.]|nr:hypothetical protein [Mucilaginibacter sp.]
MLEEALNFYDGNDNEYRVPCKANQLEVCTLTALLHGC